MTYFIITFLVFFVISLFGLIAANYKKKENDQNTKQNEHLYMQSKQKEQNKEEDEVFGDYEDVWDKFDK